MQTLQECDDNRYDLAGKTEETKTKVGRSPDETGANSLAHDEPSCGDPDYAQSDDRRSEGPSRGPSALPDHLARKGGNLYLLLLGGLNHSSSDQA